MTGSAVPGRTDPSQRRTLSAAIRSPVLNPYLRMAPAAYALQLGVNGHRTPVLGDHHRW